MDLKTYQSNFRLFFLLILLMHFSHSYTKQTYEGMHSIDLQSKELSLQVRVNEEFKFTSTIDIPKEWWGNNNFKWKDEDEWKLVRWPSAIQFLETYATAPDWIGGGALCQSWKFKALKAGTYRLLLERYSEQIVVTIVIS